MEMMKQGKFEKLTETAAKRGTQVEDALIASCEGEKKKQSAAEEKAAKIERLKSGFRICKPQGTFLWPNSINSFLQQVQVEVPTPPSVSSSTVPPQLPYGGQCQPPPPSLVKPLAEKRAVTVTVSKGHNYEDSGDNNVTNSTALVNLNNAPIHLDAELDAKRLAWESGAYETCCCPSASKWLAPSTTFKSASDHSSHG